MADTSPPGLSLTSASPVLSPGGSGFIFGVGCLAAITLWGSSSPGFAFGAFGIVLLLMLWGGAMFFGIILTIAYLAGRAKGEITQPLPGWRWLVVPTIAVLTFGIARSDALIHARFYPLRGEFAEVARDATRHPRADRYRGSWIEKRVGLYDVNDVFVLRGVVHFSIESNWFSEQGFAFSPRHAPHVEGMRYSEFEGDWYLWESELVD